MSRNQQMELRRHATQCERERDEAYSTIKHLEAELAASEEGRMKLWKMIKIFTKSEQSQETA